MESSHWAGQDYAHGGAYGTSHPVIHGLEGVKYGGQSHIPTSMCSSSSQSALHISLKLMEFSKSLRSSPNATKIPPNLVAVSDEYDI
jgi:hypothetical protein